MWNSFPISSGRTIILAKVFKWESRQQYMELTFVSWGSVHFLKGKKLRLSLPHYSEHILILKEEHNIWSSENMKFEISQSVKDSRTNKREAFWIIHHLPSAPQRVCEQQIVGGGDYQSFSVQRWTLNCVMTKGRWLVNWMDQDWLTEEVWLMISFFFQSNPLLHPSLPSIKYWLKRAIFHCQYLQVSIKLSISSSSICRKVMAQG